MEQKSEDFDEAEEINACQKTVEMCCDIKSELDRFKDGVPRTHETSLINFVGETFAEKADFYHAYAKGAPLYERFERAGSQVNALVCHLKEHEPGRLDEVQELATKIAASREISTGCQVLVHASTALLHRLFHLQTEIERSLDAPGLAP